MANENVVIDLLGTPHTNGVTGVSYDSGTNTLTLTYADASTQEIILVDDKAVSGVYDSVNNKIVLTMSDGSTIDVDMSVAVGLYQPTRTDVVATQAGQTIFTVDYNIANFDVWVDGVLLRRNEYTGLNGTSIELLTGVNIGTWMFVKSNG